MIQGVVNRLLNNSFLIFHWTVIGAIIVVTIIGRFIH